MKHLRKLLFPFSALYYGSMWVRNFCFDKGFFSSKSYDFPVICVGNLSTGGTGKTPMTEYLIRLLKGKTSLGVLSRGYGRKTKGYIKVDKTQDAIAVGDEPLQYATKFDDIQVAVCEDRRLGINKLRSGGFPPEVIVLDDAFQHRNVTPGFSILLTSYSALFYDDFILPVGNLRDLRHQARRADAIVITKSPVTLTIDEQDLIRNKITKYSHSPVYFATIQYSDKAHSLNGPTALAAFKDKEVTLVTGIANPEPLVAYLNKQNLKFTHKRYRDHYNFTAGDIAGLEACSCILTTEKDYMRLQSKLNNEKLFYLPISTSFLGNDNKRFEKQLLDYAVI